MMKKCFSLRQNADVLQIRDEITQILEDWTLHHQATGSAEDVDKDWLDPGLIQQQKLVRVVHLFTSRDNRP